MHITDSDHVEEAHDGVGPAALPDLFRFLEMHAPALLSPSLVSEVTATDGPFLAVIVRTQGRRSPLLREVLLCLACQDSDNFEVIVTAHDVVGAARDVLQADLRLLEALRPGRVRVIEAAGGTRVTPILAALESVRARYVVVLDDDDYVTADWVSTFEELHAKAPGRVLRCGCATRVTSVIHASMEPTRVAAGSAVPTYTKPWSFSDHLLANSTPFHAFAFPLFAIRSLGLQFDESLDVVEDWQFLLRVAGGLGVSDTQRITCVYNVGGEDASATSVRRDRWEQAEQSIRSMHAGVPYLSTPAPDGPSQADQDSIATDDSEERRVPRRRAFAFVYATEGLGGVVGRVRKKARDRLGPRISSAT